MAPTDGNYNKYGMTATMENEYPRNNNGMGDPFS